MSHVSFSSSIGSSLWAEKRRACDSSWVEELEFGTAEGANAVELSESDDHSMLLNVTYKPADAHAFLATCSSLRVHREVFPTFLHTGSFELAVIFEEREACSGVDPSRVQHCF